MEDRLTGSNGDVREKPSITPELTTDGGSEYASAVGTPTKGFHVLLYKVQDSPVTCSALMYSSTLPAEHD